MVWSQWNNVLCEEARVKVEAASIFSASETLKHEKWVTPHQNLTLGAQGTNKVNIFKERSLKIITFSYIYISISFTKVSIVQQSEMLSKLLIKQLKQSDTIDQYCLLQFRCSHHLEPVIIELAISSTFQRLFVPPCFSSAN